MSYGYGNNSLNNIIYNEEPKRIELDLTNPIFVVYLNVQGMSMERIVEIIDQTKRTIDIYSNITMWLVPSDVSRIECVYDGSVKTRKKELSHLIEEINKRVDILSNSRTFEDFKMNIRDWRIDKLINGKQEK